MESKFDLSFPEDFAASMELLSITDYFKIAQAEKEMFWILGQIAFMRSTEE